MSDDIISLIKTLAAQQGYADQPRNQTTMHRTSDGRQVYRDGEGAPYSERTVTVPYQGQWVNVPSVDDQGVVQPEGVVADFVAKNGPVDPVTGAVLPVFKTIEEAEQYAQQRSAQLGKELERKGL